MLEKIKAINEEIRDSILNNKFEVIECDFIGGDKNEVASTIKIDDAEVRLCCDENFLVWGYVANVHLPTFMQEERKAITKYMFCEALSRITEQSKKDIETIKNVIETL